MSVAFIKRQKDAIKPTCDRPVFILASRSQFDDLSGLEQEFQGMSRESWWNYECENAAMVILRAAGLES